MHIPYQPQTEAYAVAGAAPDAMRTLIFAAMNQVSLAIAGFCIFSSVLLFIAYAVFIRVPVKSVFSILSCAALVAALCAIEVGHWNYFQGGPRPFETTYYRVAHVRRFPRHSIFSDAGPSCRRSRFGHRC